MRALPTTPIDRLRGGLQSLQVALLRDDGHLHRRNLLYLMGGCVLVAGGLFYMGLVRIIESDHNLHLQLAQRGIDSGHWPVHFLFPALTYALSGFSREIVPLGRAALVVLTTCAVAKAWLTYGLLARCRQPQTMTTGGDQDLLRRHATRLLVLTAALFVAAPIMRPWWTQRVYFGQISPNVWHNPTSIVCWPLVILLFFAAFEFLRTGRRWMLAAIAALSAASVLAKPNYFLAFAPVFGLLALWRFGLSRRLVLSQVAMLPTVLILCWQLTASFDGPDAMRPGRHIAFLPLAAWHVYTNSIPLSLLFSLAFPLSYVILFRRSLQNGWLLGFAWAVMLSALAWTAGFAEVCADGSVDIDFNFSWGAHLALYVLFVVTVMDMLENPQTIEALGRRSTGGWQAKLPWWLFGAHAASGIYWMVRQAIGRGFG